MDKFRATSRDSPGHNLAPIPIVYLVAMFATDEVDKMNHDTAIGIVS